MLQRLVAPSSTLFAERNQLQLGSRNINQNPVRLLLFAHVSFLFSIFFWQITGNTFSLHMFQELVCKTRAGLKVGLAVGEGVGVGVGVGGS